MSLSPQPGHHLVFICGSALQGQPDHKNLTGSRFLGPAQTQPRYRLHAVADGWHPGIYEVAQGGVTIPGEVYELTQPQFEALAASEPPNMYPSDVVLTDDSVVTAFLYPQTLVQQHQWPDISDYGGWIAYKQATHQATV